MSVIAAFLVTMSGGITSLIGLFIARKATFSLAYIAVYLVLTGVFIAALTSMLSGVSASVPSSGLISAGLSLLPSNSAQCIGVISTAHVASYVFVMKNKLLNLKVKA